MVANNVLMESRGTICPSSSLTIRRKFSYVQHQRLRAEQSPAPSWLGIAVAFRREQASPIRPAPVLLRTAFSATTVTTTRVRVSLYL